ncbi:MAG: mechanosensitive ion channel [Phycisphaerales bacterium]|nr:mechanosensitive ion channel [Phycisphaerales bacterium]
MSRFWISIANRNPFRAFLLGLILSQGVPLAMAQSPPDSKDQSSAQPSPAKEKVSPVAARVDIEPVARDDQIRDRLERILIATGWFHEPSVHVEEGVVFLRGRAETDALKEWASSLAGNTQGVAAVANQMTVKQSSPWDFSSAESGLSSVWRDLLRALPLLMLALIILAVSALVAWVTTYGVRIVLRRRINSRLLRGLFARGAGVLVMVAGLYIVLRISGLTQLALTIIGGTGLIGLAVGIAFRDITENYLASIFLSVQRPFHTGDLVEIADVTGYVRQLNVRTTVLMALDGTLCQLPNAKVYKSAIRNYSSNPNRREDFVVGIGYDDRIDYAQEVARRVLSGHPAVLNDPEPWVLAEELGKATVNLRIYFWLNGQKHSWLKVRSSVIRLIKRAFQDHGISMPDEAREVIFPQGIPVTMLSDSPGPAQPDSTKRDPAQLHAAPAEHIDSTPEAVVTAAEGGLSSEADTLDEQARLAHQPDDTVNLLRGGSDDKPTS